MRACGLWQILRVSVFYLIHFLDVALFLILSDVERSITKFRPPPPPPASSSSSSIALHSRSTTFTSVTVTLVAVSTFVCCLVVLAVPVALPEGDTACVDTRLTTPRAFCVTS